MGRRVTPLLVVWYDHGDDPDEEPDWAYHLRMGGIDAEDAEVMEPRELMSYARFNVAGQMIERDKVYAFVPPSGRGAFADGR